jgi:hypothetical protein
MSTWKNSLPDNAIEYAWDFNLDSSVTGSNIELGVIPANFIVTGASIDVTKMINSALSAIVGDAGDDDGYHLNVCALNTGVSNCNGAKVYNSSDKIMIPYKISSTNTKILLKFPLDTAATAGKFVLRLFGYQA